MALFAWLFVDGKINERDEFLGYVLTWVLLPIGGYALMQLARRLRAPVPLLLSLNSFVIVAVVLALRVLPSRAEIIVLSGMALMLAALFVSSIALRRAASSIQQHTRAQIIALIGFAIALSQFKDYHAQWMLAFGVVGAALPNFFAPLLREPARWLRITLSLVAVPLLLLIVINPMLPTDVFHSSSFLAVANDVLWGKVPLVDTMNIYGVGPSYFLAAIFATRWLPITPASLTLIVMLLYVLSFAALYVVLTRMLRSTLFAFGVTIFVAFRTVAFVYDAFFSTFQNFGDTGIVIFPSHSPLRYGLPIALLLFVALGQGANQNIRRVLRAANIALIGVASLWSIVTFIYVMSAWLAMELFVALATHNAPKAILKTLALHGLAAIVSIVIFQFGYALFAWLMTGRLPDWMSYLGYNFSFGTPANGEDAFAYPVRAWDSWAVLIAANIASMYLLWIAARKSVAPDERLPFMLCAGFTALGASETIYFARASLAQILQVLATPFIAVSAFWLAQLIRKAPRHLPYTFVARLFQGAFVLSSVQFIPASPPKLIE